MGLLELMQTLYLVSVQGEERQSGIENGGWDLACVFPAKLYLLQPALLLPAPNLPLHAQNPPSLTYLGWCGMGSIVAGVHSFNHLHQ